MQNVNEAKQMSIDLEINAKLEKHQNIKEDIGFIYLIKSSYGYKIGKSKNMEQRNKLFSVKMSFHFDYVFRERITSYHNLEIKLHELFSDKHINGEWFELSEDDITQILEILKEYKVE